MDLYKYARDVVEWNWYKGGDKEEWCDERLAEALEGQGILIQAEFNELLGSISADPDMEKEFIAEACDVFVTMTYYFYLKHGYTYKCTPVEGNIVQLVTELDAFITAEEYDEGIDLIWDLLYSLEGSKEIMEAKLKSNWTKIPKSSEFFNTVGFIDPVVSLENEAKRIEKEFKGRYSGVRGEVAVGRDSRVIFKDSNNKVLKPITYKDWKEFYG